jgi:hypothetical protein
MLIFAWLYFFNPRTEDRVQTVMETVTNIVLNAVTNQVLREVPQEVERIVKVPADIPDEYIWAAKLLKRLNNATSITQDQLLFGMKDVKAAYMISEPLKEVVSEEEVKARFELVLRRNNIPINLASRNTVTLTINGFRGNDLATQDLYVYSFRVTVYDTQAVARDGAFHGAPMPSQIHDRIVPSQDHRLQWPVLHYTAFWTANRSIPLNLRENPSTIFQKIFFPPLYCGRRGRVTPHGAGSVGGVVSHRNLTNQTRIPNMKTFIVQFLAVAALVFLSACASDAPKTSSSSTTTDQSTTYHSPTTSTTTTDTQTK